jgi:hypothetical protein
VTTGIAEGVGDMIASYTALQASHGPAKHDRCRPELAFAVWLAIKAPAAVRTGDSRPGHPATSRSHP